jgi:putative hydrolase of the HAD superfamily
MRAILFDLGGTLDFPRHWLDRFVTHYQAAGIDIRRPELDDAFSAATRTAYACSAELRHYSLAQLVGLLVDLQFEHVGVHGTMRTTHRVLVRGGRGIIELKRQIRDAFVAESAIGFAISRPVLMLLARRFKIGVVSNFYGNLERVIADADLARAVTAIADSRRVGFYKPDPRIFTAALARLEVPPQEAIMVGDSLEKDCAPAHAMGMTTVWLRHRDFNNTDAALLDSADFTIEGLEELKDFGWLAS